MAEEPKWVKPPDCKWDNKITWKNAGKLTIKARDLKEEWDNAYGAMRKVYPLLALNDMNFFTTVRKTAEWNKTHRMQNHSHPGIEEHWYIIRGKGQVVIGEGDDAFKKEVKDVKPGDLVVTPHGVPHYLLVTEGELEMFVFHGNHDAWDRSIGDIHPYLAYDKPARPTEKEQASLPETGKYFEDNLIKGIRTYKPLPILKRERIGEDKSGQKTNVFGMTDGKRIFINETWAVHYFYNIDDWNDLQLMTRLHKPAEADMQHQWLEASHPDIEEYIFAISGKSKHVVGRSDESFDTEEYDVEPGDLSIVPAGVPHIWYGDIDGVWWHFKHNGFGSGCNNMHPVLVYDKPPRPTKELYDLLPNPGDFYLLDSLEIQRVCPVVHPSVKRRKAWGLGEDEAGTDWIRDRKNK